MLHSIPKRIRVQHPVRLHETEQINSSPILWPYRGAMVLGVLCFLSALAIGILADRCNYIATLIFSIRRRNKTGVIYANSNRN